MDSPANPFTALSLIAAPALLTNACSLLILGAGNRLVRAVDRARQLTTELDQQTNLSLSLSHASWELATTQRRMLMIIRAMGAFYGAVGGFAAAALISLLGAVLTPIMATWAARLIEIAAVSIGTMAVVALVRGALLLMRETRLAVQVMEEQAVQAQARFARLKKDAAEADLVEYTSISPESDKDSSESN